MGDITVYGAGIFGLAIAYACARRGAAVRLVDPLGVAAGASGGIVGALAPHAPERWTALKAFQLDSLVMAEAWWDEAGRIAGRDPLYARTGRLQPIADAAALDRAGERQRSAEMLWPASVAWRVTSAAAWRDWLPDAGTGRVIHDTLSARIAPPAACGTLARAVVALGGRLAAEPGPPSARTVWATGAAGLEAFSREVGRPVGRGVRGQAALLDLDRRAAPQLYVGGLHVVPHGDGTTAIGSTTETGPEVATDGASEPAGGSVTAASGESVRAAVEAGATDRRLDDLLDRARALVPVLATAPVLQRWAGLRPRARSRAPILGPHPGRDGHFLANGGFKIGFGLAPKVGEVMADLVLDGRDAIPRGMRVEDVL